jgi:hypothetical protein
MSALHYAPGGLEMGTVAWIRASALATALVVASLAASATGGRAQVDDPTVYCMRGKPAYDVFVCTLPRDQTGVPMLTPRTEGDGGCRARPAMPASEPPRFSDSGDGDSFACA